MSQAPAHSPIGASGMVRWKNCPASVRLARDVPNVPSDFAEEGTAAHDLAYQILCARRDGKPEPEAFGIDDDDLAHIFTYIDHMESLKDGCTFQLYEHRFHLREIHELCYGTADGVTFYADTGLLVVSDLKFGAGKFVSAEKNDQLLYYALGAVLTLKIRVKRIRIEIIQPRITYAEAIRPWEIGIVELMDFAQDLLVAAQRTEDPNAPFCAGEWCRNCPPAFKCPLMRLSAEVFMTQQQINDAEVTAMQLDWLPVLEGYAKSKREMAYVMAQRGEKIPNHKLVQKEGRREYFDEGMVPALVKSKYKLDETTALYTKPSPELLSPAQLELAVKKLRPAITKKAIKEFVDDITERPTGGTVLVREDDKRPEFKGVEAKSVFTARRVPVAV